MMAQFPEYATAAGLHKAMFFEDILQFSLATNKGSQSVTRLHCWTCIPGEYELLIFPFAYWSAHLQFGTGINIVDWLYRRVSDKTTQVQILIMFRKPKFFIHFSFSLYFSQLCNH